MAESDKPEQGYVAVVGLNYGADDIRVEAGEPLPADAPDPVIRTLLAQDAIKKAPKRKGND